VRNYHRSNGGYRQKNSYAPRRYSNFRSRRFSSKASTIRIDQLIAKAIDSDPVNIYVDDCQCSQFNVNDTLKRNILNKGYTKPTKIQHRAIPDILEGRDILGIANTGSGKTATFLIPMIDKMMKNRGNICLVVVPTRELAMQIQDEFKQLSRDTGIRNVLIMGGNDMRTQINLLRQNPQFIIATPGRLKDLSQRNVIDLSKVNNVILDEVDRMLDMGFIQDIRYIVAKLNKERQSLFFSATLDRKAEDIANQLLSNPIKIEVESESQGKNVDQDVVRLQVGQNKIEVLVSLLKQKELEKVLVFTATKRQADTLCKKLQQSQIFVEALHGDKRQNQRTRIIEKFKRGRVDVLIATDVASRGLDVDMISHVINYDMPQSYNDYIHRIGRTGRAGKKGCALTFV
jgi:ATP-dependent RNA helicase RhlE